MKILMSILFGLFLVVSPVEASHQYIWNNREYVCWLDDTTIYTNENKTWCIFDIIMEDRISGKYSISKRPMLIYKDENKYYMTILGGEVPQKEITYYDGWWQPYGLKWLQDNGYLE